MTKATFCTVLAGTIACMLVMGARGQDPNGEEAKRIAVLRSNASLKEKVDACRELAIVGTKDSVPVLAQLLGDEKLSHMARYALEPNPDPAVDQALRKALGTLKGRPLVGVIGSVGARRDKAATDALIELLASDDADVARAAARALGRMGTPRAGAALADALKTAGEDRRQAVVEGLFRHAETLSASGATVEALAVYEELLALKSAPHQVHTGALRGAVLTRGDDGLARLIRALGSKDFREVGAAVRIGQEIPGVAATKAMARELGKLPADTQVLLALTLGKRCDRAAVPNLSALARKGALPARCAALRALAEIGDPSVTPLLIDLQADDSDEVADAAKRALSALAGPEADAALLAMLERGDVEARLAAIELIGGRRMTDAVPALMRAAKDPNESVRVASLGVLGELAGSAEFSELVAQLLRAKSPAETRACERALTTVCTRLARPDAANVTIEKALYGDPPDGKSRDVAATVSGMVSRGDFTIEANNGNFGDPTPGARKKLRIVYRVDGVVHDETVPEGGTIEIRAGVAPPALAETLCKAMSDAPGQTKLALLNVLRYAGGDKALSTVQAAMTDTDPDVRQGAVAILCGWPTPDALPRLTQLAKSAAETRDRILALRGCCRLITAQATASDQKAAQLKAVLAMCERVDEKRLALSALGMVDSPAALAVVMPYLDEPALREEACLAAVAIAEATAGSGSEQTASAMQRVVETTRNKTTAKRARAVLQKRK